MAKYLSARDLDWTLLGFVLAICTLGVLQIYSATRSTIWQGAHYKQMIYIAVGLLLMWIIAQIDYHALLDRVPVLYLLSILGLVAIFIVAELRFGSRRWIP